MVNGINTAIVKLTGRIHFYEGKAYVAIFKGRCNRFATEGARDYDSTV